MRIRKIAMLLLALCLCLSLSVPGFAKVEPEISNPIFHSLCDALLGDVNAVNDDALLEDVKSTVRSMFHTGILTREQANALYNTMAKVKEAGYKDYDALYDGLCKLAGIMEPNDYDFKQNTVNVTAFLMDKLDEARIINARNTNAMHHHIPIALAPGPAMPPR